MEFTLDNAKPMNASAAVPAPAQLSTRSANLLYLVAISLMSLTLVVGFLTRDSAPRRTSPFLGLLLAEVFLVLIPALLWLKVARVPVHETLRLRWPGWRVAGSSVAIGAGLYPAAVVATGLWLLLLRTPLPFTLEALTITDALLAFASFAIAAPVCEEVLFRGVLQRAYEDRGPGQAIIVVGVLFSMFHLWLPQCLGILPLVFALGYVYWRSRSLIASMLTHFGANVCAAFVLSSTVLFPGLKSSLMALPPVLLGAGFVFLLVAGIAVTVVSLWLLTRFTQFEMVPAPAKPLSWWAESWPLPIAGAVFLAVVAAQPHFWKQNSGSFVKFTPTELAAAPWETPVRWHYEVRNIAEQRIGKALCDLSSDGQGYRLCCTLEAKGYKLKVGQGHFERGGDSNDAHTNYWSRPGLGLIRGEVVQDTRAAEHRYCWAHTYSLKDSGEIEVQEKGRGTQRLGVPRPAGKPVQIPAWAVLTPGEWPWRLSALPFASGYQASVYLFRPYAWRPETRDNGPSLTPARLIVGGLESVQTPGGTIRAWKVQVGDRETAWYGEAAPHTVVKYFNGIETWLLTRTEAGDDSSR
jgi:membrane protease YdiL (CAAX protease family)